jgi:uncharacterized protein YndB with AHSA1/START domain
MNMTDTDRLEKRVVLRAPRSRVWRALTDADEFGAWFGVRLEGPFAERIEPERYFAYRWHPYAIDVSVDYSAEPATLVEFRLGEADEGTVLTIAESGFDRIPLARRAEAFRMNDGGWTAQAKNIERHLSEPY